MFHSKKQSRKLKRNFKDFEKTFKMREKFHNKVNTSDSPVKKKKKSKFIPDKSINRELYSFEKILIINW